MAMKYRQRGYRDSERENRPSRKPPPSKPPTPEERAQQRSLRHAIDRESNEVVRCPDCGRNIPAFGAITRESACPYCNAALRCCRACRHFDTSTRWECRAPIPARVAEKGKANDCALFEARLVLDATGRRTGTPSSNDPKSAFENLFKK
jgi:hypothetical protein